MDLGFEFLGYSRCELAFAREVRLYIFYFFFYTKKAVISWFFLYVLYRSLLVQTIEEYHNVCMGNTSYHVDSFRLSCDLGYHELSWRRIYYGQEKG